MKKIVIFLFLLTYFFSATPLWAGLLSTSDQNQIVPTKYQALILFDGEKETLYNSFTFNANPLSLDNFAWIIPVPQKPEVERFKEDIFINLEEITQKKFQKKNLFEKLFYFDIKEQESMSSSLFTRPIDAIQFKIFSPDDGVAGLQTWLHEFGYTIPKAGLPVLHRYEKDDWYFVAIEMNALHLEYDARDSLTLAGAHTFPIKITFPTEKIVYPLTLASVSPDMDSSQIPYSFDYGRDSVDLLGEQSEEVDRVLSYQSSNKYPRIPLSFITTEVDVYVIAEQKMESNDFTATYANTIGKDDLQKIELPNNHYLTRLTRFTPQSLLSDYEIHEAKDTRRVNPIISTSEKLIRGGILITSILLLLFTSRRIFRYRSESTSG